MYSISDITCGPRRGREGPSDIWESGRNWLHDLSLARRSAAGVGVRRGANEELNSAFARQFLLAFDVAWLGSYGNNYPGPRSFLHASRLKWYSYFHTDFFCNLNMLYIRFQNRSYLFSNRDFLLPSYCLPCLYYLLTQFSSLFSLSFHTFWSL